VKCAAALYDGEAMAHKRMFSKDITSSDAFREMPASTQALYFHLGMEADDDGFLDNYRGLMRAINSTDDDLKILLAKRFLIVFPSKVIVVKHWRINNTIRHDRHTPTKHLEEKKALIIKDNGAYTEVWQPDGNQVATQYRIEEDRKDTFSGEKDFLPSEVTEVRTTTDGEEIKPKPGLPRKDKEAWSLMQRAVKLLKDETGTEPVTGVKEYQAILRAQKVLKEKEILEMVQDAVDNGTAEQKGLSLAAILSNIEINKYRLRQ